MRFIKVGQDDCSTCDRKNVPMFRKNDRTGKVGCYHCMTKGYTCCIKCNEWMPEGEAVQTDFFAGEPVHACKACHEQMGG